VNQNNTWIVAIIALAVALYLFYPEARNRGLKLASKKLVPGKAQKGSDSGGAYANVECGQ